MSLRFLEIGPHEYIPLRDVRHVKLLEHEMWIRYLGVGTGQSDLGRGERTQEVVLCRRDGPHYEAARRQLAECGVG